MVFRFPGIYAVPTMPGLRKEEEDAEVGHNGMKEVGGVEDRHSSSKTGRNVGPTRNAMVSQLW